MARKPTLWFWDQRHEYCTTIDGRRHRLGPDKKTAERKFHALLARPEPKVPSNTVAAVVDLFLDWTQQHRATLTYVGYKRHLQSFVDTLPRLMTVDRLRAHHIDSWIDSHKRWGNSFRRGAIGAVARCFNWAFKKDHIEHNPIWKKLDKPPATRREVVVSPTEFKALLKHLKGDFRDLVVTVWETGCRPQEVRNVEARHVDLQQGRWVFPAPESKGKRVQRVVYESGALENPAMSQFVTDVLEGTRWAFGVRGDKYKVGDSRETVSRAI